MCKLLPTNIAVCSILAKEEEAQILITRSSFICPIVLSVCLHEAPVLY